MEDKERKSPARLDVHPPNHSFQDPRHSYASSISNISFEAEVGEAVSMPMAESQGEAQMKQMNVQNVGHTVEQNTEQNTHAVQSVTGSVRSEDKESVFSASSVQLGRLDTVKKTTSPAKPEITLETSLDSVVPPRSKRRPVSEILPGQFGRPRHTKHNSLTISEDLDKLMASASGLKLEPEVPRAQTQPSSPKNKKMPIQPKIGTQSGQSRASTESFQTAEEELLSSSPEPPAAMKLPRRPTQDNMARARQASLKKLGADDLDDVSDAASQSTWIGRSGSVGRNPSLKRNATITAQTPGAKTDDQLKRIPSTSSRYVSSENVSVVPNADASPAFSTSSRKPKPPMYQTELSSTSSFHVHDDTFSRGHTHSPKKPESPQKSMHHKDSPEAVSPEIPAQEIPFELPQSYPKEPQIEPQYENIEQYENVDEFEPKQKVYDDGYYDVEEPLVVSKPARAKSVRDNIKDPAKSKKKSRRKQRATDRGSQLRPFSYNTLIHLLESINGTVIGQEFEELNLPFQEKQLIEKVIDSLSRLTSDMVVDKNRYEVGIQRLEKAHRVLEGFL